jgi:hypothetical protein
VPARDQLILPESEPPHCGRKALRSVENSGIPGGKPSG